MPVANNVVTPTRFLQGLSWGEFLARAVVNRDRFEHYYRTSPLSDDDFAFFKKAASATGGAAKILAIGEHWCGDVYRELPTVAKIAESAGADLRIFLRDENPDIMDEFLSHGKARAIPVFVFYTRDLAYITHFIERPVSAQTEIDSILNHVRAKFGQPSSATFTTLPDAARQEVIASILPRFPEWQKDSIREMRALLAKALNISNA